MRLREPHALRDHLRDGHRVADTVCDQLYQQNCQQNRQRHTKLIANFFALEHRDAHPHALELFYTSAMRRWYSAQRRGWLRCVSTRVVRCKRRRHHVPCLRRGVISARGRCHGVLHV